MLASIFYNPDQSHEPAPHPPPDELPYTYRTQIDDCNTRFAPIEHLHLPFDPVDPHHATRFSPLAAHQRQWMSLGYRGFFVHSAHSSGQYVTFFGAVPFIESAHFCASFRS